jgi:membrane-associated phospholipid phosphatase
MLLAHGERRDFMDRRIAIWVVVFLFTLVLILLAARFPYFPGDVQVARGVQALTRGGENWARWISNTARAPWSYVLLGLTLALAWLIHGWRAAFLSMASFWSLSLLDPVLKAWIARPRPSPDLIHVAGSSPGFSMPSTFALVYISTFGFLAALALVKGRLSRRANLILLIPCVALLVIGGVARILLGAHWPSDVAVSYLIGFL